MLWAENELRWVTELCQFLMEENSKSFELPNGKHISQQLLSVGGRVSRQQSEDHKWRCNRKEYHMLAYMQAHLKASEYIKCFGAISTARLKDDTSSWLSNTLQLLYVRFADIKNKEVSIVKTRADHGTHECFAVSQSMNGWMSQMDLKIKYLLIAWMCESQAKSNNSHPFVSVYEFSRLENGIKAVLAAWWQSIWIKLTTNSPTSISY